MGVSGSEGPGIQTLISALRTHRIGMDLCVFVVSNVHELEESVALCNEDTHPGKRPPNISGELSNDAFSSQFPNQLV